MSASTFPVQMDLKWESVIEYIINYKVSIHQLNLLVELFLNIAPPPYLYLISTYLILFFLLLSFTQNPPNIIYLATYWKGQPYFNRTSKYYNSLYLLKIILFIFIAMSWRQRIILLFLSIFFFVFVFKTMFLNFFNISSLSINSMVQSNTKIQRIIYCFFT